MKAPSTISVGISPQLINHFRLPRTGKYATGPVHSLVTDEQGNIYYSDEINHVIVALDAQGSLRWHRGGQGGQPDQFRYPRGLSEGWIRKDAVLRRCIGVADAWNRRLQFFGLDGELLDVWHRAGDSPYGEVTDLRFMSKHRRGSVADDAQSYWLILDRGNHRLCAADPSGRPLFEFGQGLTPHVTGRWVAPHLCSDDGSLAPGTIEFSPFDFLFYPTRILGSSEEALYIWEPFSQKLKQVLYGNFLPISVRSLPPDEWIAADSTGFVGWCPEGNRVRHYDCSGILRHDFEVQGTAVSCLGSDYFWVQTEDALERFTWNSHSEESVQASTTRFFCLRLTAEEELALENTEHVEQALKGVLEAMHHYERLAGELRCLMQSPDLDQLAVKLLRERWGILRNSVPPRRIAFYSALHGRSLANLKLRLTRAFPSGLDQRCQLGNTDVASVTQRVRNAFLDLVTLSDELFMLNLSLPGSPSAASDAARDLASLASAMESEVRETLTWLSCWAGGSEVGNGIILHGPETGEPDSCAAGSLIRRPAPRAVSHVSSYLREVDRLSLAAWSASDPMGPAYLAVSQEGHLYVSLFRSHVILHLDANGSLISTIGRPGTLPGELQGPLGLAVDSRNRLWVSDFANHRVQVYDERRDIIQEVGGTPRAFGGFDSPTGLCLTSDESVLVADVASHRVIRVSPSGSCAVVLDQVGRSPGQIRQPNSFCVDLADGDAFWLVDARNHRIQKFDLAGRFISQFGGPGLNQDCLFLPVSMAMFGDETLVVAQNRLNRCLKFFSPEGEEFDRLDLAYAPAGMLVQQGRLLVCELDGSSIVVYERR